MRKDWRCPAEGLVDQDMVWCRGYPLLGAQHVGNGHQMIIDQMGKVVDGHTALLDQHDILELIVAHRDSGTAAHQIVKTGLALKGGLEADGIGASTRRQLTLALQGPIAFGATEAERLMACCFGGSTQLGELLLTGEGEVGQPSLKELVTIVLVDPQILALRLHIGGVGATNIRTLIPIETDPAQGGDNIGGGTFNETLLVGILKAKDELPTIVASKEPVEESGAYSTNVEIAGGAGCEAYPHRCGNPGHDGDSMRSGLIGWTLWAVSGTASRSLSKA